MKEKLKQMGYKMQQSMIGRYGIDALYKALLVIYLILVVTGSALARVSRPVYTVLWVLSLAVLIYAIFRSFSRNIAARQRENARWLALTAPIRREGRLLRDKWTFRKTHVFKKCPGCKAVLRLPRKKGKHTVNCPHCHKNFTVHVHGYNKCPAKRQGLFSQNDTKKQGPKAAKPLRVRFFCLDQS